MLRIILMSVLSVSQTCHQETFDRWQVPAFFQRKCLLQSFWSKGLRRIYKASIFEIVKVFGQAKSFVCTQYSNIS